MRKGTIGAVKIGVSLALLAAAVIFSVCFIFPALANLDDTVNTIVLQNPANNTYIKGTIILNASLSGTNVSDNATFYYQNSTGYFYIGLNTTIGPSNFTRYFDTATLTDGVYSFFVNATNLTGAVANVTNGNITVDGTAPTISIAAPTAGQILKVGADGFVWVNGTIYDNLGMGSANISLNSTAFSIWSFSGANNTAFAIRNNTAIADGAVHINVGYLDAAGNAGNATRNFTVDGTAPTISIINPTNASALAAGTASTWINITTDENATCRYNLTNSTFNYAEGTNFTNTGGLNHSFQYSGLSAGAFNLYYKCNDTAGNVNNQSAYHVFSVAAAAAPATPSSGGSGGGSISTTAKSIAVTPNEIITKIAVNLKIAVASPAIFAAQVSAIPAPAPSEPVYQYINITKSNFNNSNIENATIDFAVNKSWLTQNNITSVYLARYENGWNKLKTELINSTGAANQYRAYTDAFSYFAIAGEKAAAVQPIIPENITQPGNETITNETQMPAKKPADNLSYIIAIIISAALIIGAAGLYFADKKGLIKMPN